METNNNRNLAALIHISALSQYFFPLGNFIFPIVIWSSLKEKSQYINSQGKRVINFQLSLLVYTLILAMIAIPIFVTTFLQHVSFNEMVNHNNFFIKDFNLQQINGMVGVGIMAVIVFGMLKTAEFFLIIYGAVKSANGEDFKYPLTIPFLGENSGLNHDEIPYKTSSSQEN